MRGRRLLRVTYETDSAPPEIAFRWSAFDELTAREVHDLLRLRCLVFVVEQACAFAEIDGLDPDAIHLRLTVGDDDAVRIGRIVTAAGYRGRGFGGEMMAEALRYAGERFPDRDIVLSAQSHLETFYAGHGFHVASEPYDEDGIPHIDMRRAAASQA